jgi:NAD(P)H dehydrogenase (quinone)
MKFLRATFCLRNYLRAWPSAGSAGPDKTTKWGRPRLYAGTAIGRLGCGHGRSSRKAFRRWPQWCEGNRSQASTDAWSTPLRVFILYANPVALSFGSALHRQVITTLRSRGHETDDCDLYAESFDPVMGEQERMQYHNAELNRATIAGYANRLLAAEALVLVYPVWNEGFPAILKGFFDRVFIPGVSFTIGPDGAAVPNLQKLRKLAALCTYGASRMTSILLGDPPKRVVKRLVRSMPGHSVRCDYLAHYAMDHSSTEQRAAFLEKVKRTFDAW